MVWQGTKKKKKNAWEALVSFQTICQPPPEKEVILTSGSAPRPFFNAQNQDNGGKGKFKVAKKAMLTYIKKSWAKKEEWRDKQVYVGSVG